jgi:hypothetical protein
MEPLVALRQPFQLEKTRENLRGRQEQERKVKRRQQKKIEDSINGLEILHCKLNKQSRGLLVRCRVFPSCVLVDMAENTVVMVVDRKGRGRDFVKYSTCYVTVFVILVNHLDSIGLYV